jgi:integrase
MASKVLTQLAVDRFKPPANGREIHWDALLPGFGLRITANGARSWIAMYRVAGKSVMQTIGSQSAIPKVDDARKLAREAILVARTGVNPVEIRRAEEAEQDRTFKVVADRYLREHADRHLGTAWNREVRRILARDVIPCWGDRPIRDIARSDVNALLDKKAVDAPVQANRELAAVSGLFGWAASHDLADANPAAGVRRRAKETPRDRILDDNEIVRFWASCEALAWPFGPMFQLLLLTAQRRDEVGGMRWSELDLERREWMLPRERAKNGRAHVIHLSAPAIEIIAGLPRFESDIVFLGATGVTPASGFSRAKERLDMLMGDPPAWILHDLRRSAASGMARLGVGPHVVDKILAHSGGTIRGVAAVYNRFEYLPERAAALDAWGRFIESLVRPSPTNVVALRN